MFFAIISTASATYVPAPSGVFIKGISYGGSGCPQGSVASVFNDDRTSLTLIFDSWPGIPITNSRKNCQIAADIRVPQGFTYAVANIDYRGFVQLPHGGSAQQDATYYFQASRKQYTATSKWFGPITKDYLASDVVPFASQVYCECSAIVPLNINTKIRVSVPYGTAGQLTTDSIDAKVKQIYGFSWKKC